MSRRKVDVPWVEWHYELAFPDETSANAALSEGLQRSPHSGQVQKPRQRRGASEWHVYFQTFDADPATSEASGSVQFFRALAVKHAGRYVGYSE